MPAPFAIYADFEAVTEKMQGCELNNNKSYTNKYQKHTSWFAVMMINIQNQ